MKIKINSLEQKEQALNTIKQNGRSDVLSNILNKQTQIKHAKIKETSGHITKVKLKMALEY